MDSEMPNVEIDDDMGMVAHDLINALQRSIRALDATKDTLLDALHGEFS